MNCLICKTDISQEIQQFGKPDAPICCSCFLNDKLWVYSEPVLVDELKRGATLEQGIKTAIKKEMTELEVFAMNFFEVTE